jgi:hypothetical protein
VDTNKDQTKKPGRCGAKAHTSEDNGLPVKKPIPKKFSWQVKNRHGDTILVPIPDSTAFSIHEIDADTVERWKNPDVSYSSRNLGAEQVAPQQTFKKPTIDLSDPEQRRQEAKGVKKNKNRTENKRWVIKNLISSAPDILVHDPGQMKEEMFSDLDREPLRINDHTGPEVNSAGNVNVNVDTIDDYDLPELNETYEYYRDVEKVTRIPLMLSKYFRWKYTIQFKDFIQSDSPRDLRPDMFIRGDIIHNNPRLVRVHWTKNLEWAYTGTLSKLTRRFIGAMLHPLVNSLLTSRALYLTYINPESWMVSSDWLPKLQTLITLLFDSTLYYNSHAWTKKERYMVCSYSMMTQLCQYTNVGISMEDKTIYERLRTHARTLASVNYNSFKFGESLVENTVNIAYGISMSIKWVNRDMDFPISGNNQEKSSMDIDMVKYRSQDYQNLKETVESSSEGLLYYLQPSVVLLLLALAVTWICRPSPTQISLIIAPLWPEFANVSELIPQNLTMPNLDDWKSLFPIGLSIISFLSCLPQILRYRVGWSMRPTQ